MKTRLISVVVPSVRGATVTDTVDAIRSQTDLDWELIVSDQSGTDTLEKALSACGDARVRRVACPGRGASLARNVGVLAARGDVIAFTDDDCRPRPDWLATIRALFDADPNLWMATGGIVPPAGWRPFGLGTPGLVSVCPSYVPHERRGRPSDGGPRIYSVTANAAYRREAFAKAGPFDVCLSPGTEFCGGEEDDHGLRMEAFDPVLMSTPRLVVEHTHGARSGPKAAWRIKRNYAYSVGAVAGKRTLLGDPHGAAMVGDEFAALRRALRRPWTGAWGPALARALYMRRGYRRALAGYGVDARRRLLVPHGSALRDLYAAVPGLLDFALPPTATPELPAPMPAAAYLPTEGVTQGVTP